MWFFKKRSEKKQDNNCKELTQGRIEIDLLRDKICQVQSDLNELHNLHNCLVSEYERMNSIVTELHTKGTDASKFIEQFREMIIVGYKLLGYNESWYPLSDVPKMAAKAKKTKKKSNG